ncbi:leucine-rich repeat protein [Flavobacterium nitratireducens]|uniref:leucine-rich repeat protein n=1 Tax=Flavobacterium nitratireducens TaxID=992289 RepID=UPI0024153D7D|nr:leucine-rich repeat protein [Flavobacterium nitratireducens]
MNKNKKFYLAKTKIQPNTFIGGVSASINTAALVASKLGISASRIKAFSVIGSDIQFAVTGGSYVIPNSAFQSSTITYYNDVSGLCTSVGSSGFRYCTFQYCTFPAVTKIGQHGFGNVTFLSDVTFPAWNDVGSNEHCFFGAKFTNFYAPAMVNLNKVGNSQVFNSCQVTGEMVLANLAVIGSSVSTNSSTFSSMTGGGILRVPVSLLTVNGGYPDPDLEGVGNSVEVDYIGYVSDSSYNFELRFTTPSYNRKTIASVLNLNNAVVLNFQIVGEYVRFKLYKSTFQLNSSNFSANTNIKEFNDIDSKCTRFGYRNFRTASNLTKLIANGVTEIVDECIYGCNNLSTLNLNGLKTISGSYNAITSNVLTSVSFPVLTNVTITGSVIGCAVLANVYIPMLTVMNTNAGGTFITNNNQCANGVAITISSGAQTSNGGGVDADLQALITNKSAVVTYV